MANAFASFVAGQQAGQAARQYQQQQEDRNALRSLAPQVVAGDTSAFSQAAAINPDVAQAYQGAGDAQARRFKGALDYFDQARKSQNPQAVQAAFKQISPYLSQVTGQQAPDSYDEASMGPAFEQLRARIAMTPATGAGDVVQSQKVGADGFIYNTFRDGRIVNTGVKADRQMWLRDHPGMPPELVGKDGATLPVGAQMPGQVEQIGGEQVRIDPSLPPQVQEQLRAQLAAGQQPSANMVLGAQARPSEAQTAAQVEAARQATQLQYAPALQQIETQGAIDRAAGVAQAQSQVERAAAAPGTIATLQGSLDSIDALLNSPELGSIVGIGSMNPLNKIPGTNARGLIARADQIAGQAFLAAFNQLKGGGAITEREGAAATAAMARLDRSQSLEDYKAALRELKAAIEPAIARARQAAHGQQSQAPAPGGWGIQRVN